MGLLRENCSHLGRLLPFYLILFSIQWVKAQSICTVRVAVEPNVTSVLSKPTKAEQISISGQKNWEMTEKAITSDDAWATLDLPGQFYSSTLKLSQFGFNLPQGAIIKGIKVNLEGKRSGNGTLKEYGIRLSSQSTQSANMAGKGFNASNVWAKSSTDRKWSYGYEDQMWGMNWNAAMINDPSFGLSIDLINFSTQAVKAELDAVTIEVFYEPLPTFCLTDVFSVYVDQRPDGCKYMWQVPQGFEWTSKSTNHYIVDFKASYAQPGIYPFCVDIYGYNNEYLASCCRDIRIRNCTPSTLGNFVWNDINYNGLQDSGEPGIKDVKVELYSNANTLIQTATTNAAGQYQFTNITEGSYYVTVKLPADYLTTAPNATDANTNSDFVPNTNSSDIFFLPYGSNRTDLDFGLVKKMKLGDFVWEDSNYNGIQDAGESGIAGVTVKLYNEIGNPVGQTTTDAAGKYSFDNLPASIYEVEFLLSATYLPTLYQQGSATANSDVKTNFRTGLLNFQNSTSQPGVDAGFYRYASLGDFVWNDKNLDGKQAANETGTEGLRIYLINANGVLLDSIDTDAEGHYQFDSLTPGKYKVKIDLPSATKPTLTSAAPNGSKLEEVNGMFVSQEVTLTSNQYYDQLDLGYIDINSSIGGLVFRDFNNNGSKETNEPGIEAIQVNLFDDNLQIVNTIATTTTGEYRFDNLLQGNYFVSFEIADSLQFTDADVAADDIDSDVLDRIGIGFTDVVSLAAADTLSHVFAGVCRRSTVGDRVWEDRDFNGIQDIGEPGIEGVTVYLLDNTGTLLDQTQTDTEGKYTFQFVVTGAYQIQFEYPATYRTTQQGIGNDQVNSDVDATGLVDAVNILLGIDNMDLDAGLVKILNLGNFVWEDLNANGLQEAGEPGLDQVEIIAFDKNGVELDRTLSNSNGAYNFSNLPSIDVSLTFNAPSGFVATQNLSTPADINSDINISGSTGLLSLAGQSSIDDVDAGFYRKACIGDFIWLDNNEDGIQNGTDGGLSDVMVILYDDQDNQVEIFVSNGEGEYHFCGLKPGRYYMTATPKEGYFPTATGTGSALQNFGNGIYKTPLFTVQSGDDISDLDLGFVYKPEADICGLVFEDQNADGRLSAGENGIGQVKVELVDKDFNTLTETFTDAEGKYCFQALLPGDYYVRFYIADSLQFTDANIGSDDLDSDAEGIVDLAVTQVVSLAAATNRNDVFAGLTHRSSISGLTWFDFAKDGIINGTEPGIPGISVELLDETGSLITSTTTSLNPAGSFSFSKLVKGTYRLKYQVNPNFDFTLKGVDPILGSIANADGSSDLLAVLPNANIENANAGYALKGGGIEGKIWLDVNKNKEQDSNDEAIILTTVTLYDVAGQPVKSTQTDLEGRYEFFPLDAGMYYVVFDTAAIHSFVMSDPLFLQSDVNHENGRGSTRFITVVNGSIESGIDAGVFDIRSSVTGFVFEDKNGNGQFGSMDSLWEGVTVNLWKEGVVVNTTQSGVDGSYRFENLMPGNYQVEIVNTDTLYTTAFYQFQGADTLLDSDILMNGFSDTLTLGICDMLAGINGGFRGFGKIIGEGFVDENENGLNDDNIEALNDIQVSLVDVFNQIVFMDTTRIIEGKPGFFAFDKVPAGSYKLKIKRPLFYVFTLQNQGGGAQEDIDSDVILTGNAFAYSDFIQLVKDGIVDDQDFGLVFRTPAISSINGKVWKEVNADGLRTVGEPPLAGRVLTLFKSDGSQVGQQVTNEMGEYRFDMLIEGYYYIKAALAPGETYTYYKEGNDPTIDSDFSSNYKEDASLLFYLGISADTTNLDLGITEELVFGDFVWDDLNDDGIQNAQEPGIENVNVSVVRADGKVVRSTTSGVAGAYAINRIPSGNHRIVFDIPEGYSASHKQAGGSAIDSDINEDGRTDLAFFPAPAIRNDIDAGFVKNATIGDFVWIDFNANGIQNTGEPGKDSIVIRLYDEMGNLVKTTQSFTEMATGVQGRYKFDNVRPGTYFIEFVIPQGYKIVPNNIGDDETDSDIDEIGVVSLLTVLPGEVITHIDAGIFLPGCIGNRVWVDADKNGIQDAGEAGLPNTEVKLFRSNGVLVASGTTNEEGMYQFNDLPQGLYFCEFVVDPLYVFTITDQGDETTDSDADATGVTPLISLAHGAKYFDLDAGVYLENGGIEEKPVGIIEVGQDELTISPNPANFETSILAPLQTEKVWMQDATGKVIYVWTPNGQTQRVDLRNLRAGVYYISYETKNDIKTKRLIKVD